MNGGVARRFAGPVSFRCLVPGGNGLGTLCLVPLFGRVSL